MLSKKIRLVKNIMIIISLTLSFISMLKSCTFAWTFEDFIQFLDSTKTANINNNAKKSGTYLLNHVNDFKTAVTNLGYNLDNYESFVVMYNDSSAFDARIAVFVNEPEYTISSSYIQLNNGTTANGRARIEFNHRINGSWETSGQQTYTATNYSMWALLTTSPISR